MSKIVDNISTLRNMAKAGLITLHAQTGTKITTLYSKQKHTCCYIDDGKPSFEYRGKKYGVKYFDGCFNPFVVEYDEKTINKPEFILAL